MSRPTVGARTRPLLQDPQVRGGGGCCLGPWRAPADKPNPQHQKSFPPAKNELYQRGRKFEVDFRQEKVFVAADPPPLGGGVT